MQIRRPPNQRHRLIAFRAAFSATPHVCWKPDTLSGCNTRVVGTMRACAIAEKAALQARAPSETSFAPPTENSLTADDILPEAEAMTTKRPKK